MCMPLGTDIDFFLPAASSSEIAEVRRIPEDRKPRAGAGTEDPDNARNAATRE